MKQVQYLVTLEYRYSGIRNNEASCKQIIKTIGVFENKEEAFKNANIILEGFEKRFPLNPNYKIKRRFDNSSFYLLSELGYIKTPFSFFLKVTKLKPLICLDTDLDEILKDIKAFKQLKDED